MSLANLDKLAELLNTQQDTFRADSSLGAVVPNQWKVLRPTRSKNGYLHFTSAWQKVILSGHFSPRLFQLMNDSPIRAYEINRNSAWTEIVNVRVPRIEVEDCLVMIEVGSVDGIVNELGMTRTAYSHDHFIYSGAAIAKLRTFIGIFFFEGLCKSDLRSWEERQNNVLRTDCAELELLDETSSYGRLKLRINYERGHALANELCSV
ncbi:hypothetical protein IQ07DRAFT_606599 [Pyrenochaeta sp. DS3sAY3a]|nr:hypothetical protein IQ07DRAFT_606599 [Pyrenochaeta sp. DS3sAY3a]